MNKVIEPLKLNIVLVRAWTALPYGAELLMKLVVPLKCNELADAQIAAPQ